MAVVKMMESYYMGPNGVAALIKYIVNPEKTYGLFGGYGIGSDNPDMIIYQMQQIKRWNHKEDVYKHRQMRHFIVSFEEGSGITPDMAYRIGFEVSKFYGDRYQVCYGVHQNEPNLHIHFGVNTVNHRTGRMYREDLDELKLLKAYVDEVIEKAMGIQKNSHGVEWLEQF